VLSGTASWLYGGHESYREQKPGDIIYNHPGDLHGMKTEKEPLLALYFLWGNKTKGYSY
jgi:quercetin dioxygenase-like cupin family protein